MQKPYNVTVDLYAGYVAPTNIIYISGDRDTMPLSIALTANGEPFVIPVNAVVSMEITRADGVELPRHVPVEDYDKGLLLYDVNGEDIAIPGRVEAVVTVVNDNERMTWQPFSYAVSGSRHASDDPEKPWRDDVDRQLSNHEGRIADIEVQGGGIPDAPVDGKTYGRKDCAWAEVNGGNEGTAAWLPDVTVGGDISWVRSMTTVPPEPRNITGPQGKDGGKGDRGADGNTPVRGIDYWTASDVEYMVSEVLTRVVDGNEVRF